MFFLTGTAEPGGAGRALAPPPPLLRRMTFYFVLVYLVYFIQANYFKKYLAENAVNTISETLDFKIFWERMPPDPPTSSHTSKYAPPSLSQLFTIALACVAGAKMEGKRGLASVERERNISY